MELERGFRVHAIVATPLLVQSIALFRRDVPVPRKLYLDGTFIGRANWPLCLLALVSRSLPETRRQGCLRSQEICPTFFSAGVFIYGAEAIYGIISRRAINLPACLGADAHAASSAKGRKVPKRG